MSEDYRKFYKILTDFKRCWKILINSKNFYEILNDSKRLQQNKVVVISVLSGIAIEGFKTLLIFLFHKF